MLPSIKSCPHFMNIFSLSAGLAPVQKPSNRGLSEEKLVYLPPKGFFNRSCRFFDLKKKLWGVPVEAKILSPRADAINPREAFCAVHIPSPSTTPSVDLASCGRRVMTKRRHDSQARRRHSQGLILFLLPSINDSSFSSSAADILLTDGIVSSGVP